MSALAPSPARTAQADPRAGFAGPAWLAVAIVATLPLFWFGLAGLADAWSRPEFSHGPVIPLLSFYLFLREMKAVPPIPATGAPVADRWPGSASSSSRSPSPPSATSSASTTWSSTR